MAEVRFLTEVGEDQVIRPPAGTSIPVGSVEVVVRDAISLPAPDPPDSDPLAKTRAWLLAMAAEAESIEDSLPDDMAENHDHYAHGAPNR